MVSRSVEGPIHRTDYRTTRKRALQLAKRLEADGVVLGDRVATMAWNTWRHLEAWYGITGIGAIYHTLNPRLFPDQIAWIMNDAEDSVLLVDLTFLPIVEAVAPKVPSLRRIVVLTDAEHMPQTALPGAVAYEEWLAEADGDFEWRRVRRAHRRRHVLHLRHDRRPEGRRLQPSFERSSRHDGDLGGHAEAEGARPADAGRAAVPRQWLVDGLLRPDGGMRHGAARRRAWTASRSTRC